MARRCFGSKRYKDVPGALSARDSDTGSDGDSLLEPSSLRGNTSVPEQLNMKAVAGT